MPVFPKKLCHWTTGTSETCMKVTHLFVCCFSGSLVPVLLVGFQANRSGSNSNQTKLQKMKSEINFKSLPGSLTNPSSQQNTPYQRSHANPTHPKPTFARISTTWPPGRRGSSVIWFPIIPREFYPKNYEFPLWKRHSPQKLSFPFFLSPKKNNMSFFVDTSHIIKPYSISIFCHNRKHLPQLSSPLSSDSKQFPTETPFLDAPEVTASSCAASPNKSWLWWPDWDDQFGWKNESKFTWGLEGKRF